MLKVVFRYHIKMAVNMTVKNVTVSDKLYTRQLVEIVVDDRVGVTGMRSGNIFFITVSGLCVWKITEPTLSIEQICRSKRLM